MSCLPMINLHTIVADNEVFRGREEAGAGGGNERGREKGKGETEKD